MNNYTSIKIPKKYQPYIYEIEKIDDGWEGAYYSVALIECCYVDRGTHTCSYDTRAELLGDLENIQIIKTEEEYIRDFGEDLISDFREDYKGLFGSYPPKSNKAERDVKADIKAIRAKSGLSQAAFAEKYNIPKRTIEGWEAGERECPVYVVELLKRAVEEDFR